MVILDLALFDDDDDDSILIPGVILLLPELVCIVAAVDAVVIPSNCTFRDVVLGVVIMYE